LADSIPNRTLIIEACVDTVESAIAAQRGGADRMELCASLLEGGTTPSSGAIEIARNNVSIPIYVMIRPRGGDFLYSHADFEVMKRDVEMAKSLGVDGVALGILTKDGDVDIQRTRELIERARPLDITFHRAFDMTRDPHRSLEELIALGVNRVLTSGQEASAAEGVRLIRSLVEAARGRIAIMAGGGLNESNIRQVVTSGGVRELHFSGRSELESAMHYRNPNVRLSSAQQPSEYLRFAADPERIERMREKAQSGVDES
jgi:copper homeostasis protein